MKKNIKLSNINFKLDNKGRSPAYYPQSNINFTLNSKIISEIKKIYFESKTKFRVCLHSNKVDKVHVMIVILTNKDQSPAHLHKKKDEFYNILFGEMNIKIYNKVSKKIKTNFLMGKKNSNFLIIKKNTIHKVEPKSNYVIFVETRMGPFNKNDSIMYKI